MHANRRLYTAGNAMAAYRLHYLWTSWLREGGELPWPRDLSASLESAWERDGLRCMRATRTRERVQILFSTLPNVAPVLLAARAKGRLTHALRLRGIRHRFSRKLSVRTIGENTRGQVEHYVESQVPSARWVDARFESLLSRFTTACDDVNLREPTIVRSGRYWYDLHVVLCTDWGHRFTDARSLGTLHESAVMVARRGGHSLSRLSVMPDHMHLVLRGKLECSPEEIVGEFQNGVCLGALGQHIWRDTYYVGTMGEYNMEFIRRAT